MHYTAEIHPWPIEMPLHIVLMGGADMKPSGRMHEPGAEDDTPPYHPQEESHLHSANALRRGKRVGLDVSS